MHITPRNHCLVGDDGDDTTYLRDHLGPSEGFIEGMGLAKKMRIEMESMDTSGKFPEKYGSKGKEWETCGKLREHLERIWGNMWKPMKFAPTSINHCTAGGHSRNLAAAGLLVGTAEP